VRGAFVFVAQRFERFETKDRVLALAAPIALLSTFGAWLVLALASYSLLIWGVASGPFGTAIRESCSSMFTLGIASSTRTGLTAVEFAAAATGPLVVALEIAYLPTIYNAFNRRETLVTMLESRAGIPAWGPEILARHQLVGIVDNLPSFYGEWEQWAADVDESHSNYTVLASFRSPHPLRSWVLALLAVLDSAALYNALSPERVPSEARLCLRMGFTCLRDIATALKMPFNADPLPTDPIQLTFEQFRAGAERLRGAGFAVERSDEEAWPHFRGWRVNYESIAYALADFTIAAPAPWSGPRRYVRGTIEPKRPADRRPDDVEGNASKALYPRPPAS
jgi:hypothetical protein